MSTSVYKSSIGITLSLAVVAGSIVIANTTLRGQASSSGPSLIYIDHQYQEADIPANTHIGLQYFEGNTVSIDQGVRYQGDGEWYVYRYDGTEPPFNSHNFFVSDALRQRHSGSFNLTSFQPNMQYYIHTDTSMIFSPLTGLRLQELCGNGTVEEEETCDSVKGCTTDCAAQVGYTCVSETNSCSVLVPTLGGMSSSAMSSSESSQEDRTPVCGNGDPSRGGEDTEDGEECDDGNLISGDGCSGPDHPNGSCTVEFCGDGYLDVDGVEGLWMEQCDDGSVCFKDGKQMEDSNGMPIRCTRFGHDPVCGSDTECVPVSFDGCSSNCILEICGDEEIDPDGPDNIRGNADDEECDDGSVCVNSNDDVITDSDGNPVKCNKERDLMVCPTAGGRCAAIASDGCSTNCKVEDGWSCAQMPSVCTQIAAPEDDDGGDTNATTKCSDSDGGKNYDVWGETKIIVIADNRVLRTKEDKCSDADNLTEWFCDGNAFGQSAHRCQYGCDTDKGECKKKTIRCGDGVTEGNEQCDDADDNGKVCTPAYGSSCEYCSNECRRVGVTGPACGDSNVDTAHGEECDDGNTQDGDGCDSTCKNESTTGGTCDPVITTVKKWEGSTAIHTKENPRPRFYPTDNLFRDSSNGRYLGTRKYSGDLPVSLASNGTMGSLYGEFTNHAWDNAPTHPNGAYVKTKYWLLGTNKQDHLHYMLRDSYERTSTGRSYRYHQLKWFFTVDYNTMKIVNSQRIPETMKNFTVMESTYDEQMDALVLITKTSEKWDASVKTGESIPFDGPTETGIRIMKPESDPKVLSFGSYTAIGDYQSIQNYTYRTPEIHIIIDTNEDRVYIAYSKGTLNVDAFSYTSAGGITALSSLKEEGLSMQALYHIPSKNLIVRGGTNGKEVLLSLNPSNLQIEKRREVEPGEPNEGHRALVAPVTQQNAIYFLGHKNIVRISGKTLQKTEVPYPTLDTWQYSKYGSLKTAKESIAFDIASIDDKYKGESTRLLYLPTIGAKKNPWSNAPDQMSFFPVPSDNLREFTFTCR